MPAPTAIESSFAFYPAEMTALQHRLAELAAAGVLIRRARFLRALVHLTPEAELFACAQRLAEAYARKDGPRETDGIAGRPAVELLPADLAKLDRVKQRLAREKLFPTANRAFVLRALVRWCPGGLALAPAIRQFLADNPNKPRGLSKLRLARQAKRRG